MEKAKRVRYQWTDEKKVALLTQIVATGKNAFMTAKGSKAVDDFVSQLDVWTNAETGIIPLLNMHAPESGVQGQPHHVNVHLGHHVSQ
mmetsp:Transcript_17994/g.50507  ORF Transcript_17994/g.50507 Transcript_17994/m.50507 type:complete len:88 (-) Transcript_17994:462-725(-)